MLCDLIPNVNILLGACVSSRGGGHETCGQWISLSNLKETYYDLVNGMYEIQLLIQERRKKKASTAAKQ